MRMLSLALVMLAALDSGALCADTIYKHTTPDGQTVFSDQPVPGAQEVEIPDTNTAEAPAPDPHRPPPPQAQTQPKAPAFKGYTRFAFSSPAPDTYIGDGSGNVTVQLEVEPGLQPEHTVRLLLDGASVEKPRPTTSFNLQNLDRGEHTLEARILSPEGKVLKRAHAVRFTVFRASVIKPNQPARPPAPHAP